MRNIWSTWYKSIKFTAEFGIEILDSVWSKGRSSCRSIIFRVSEALLQLHFTTNYLYYDSFLTNPNRPLNSHIKNHRKFIFKFQILQIVLHSCYKWDVTMKDWTLTDTGDNVQKWTRVFSTRRWVILVARTRRKQREENSVSTFGRFRLWTSFESSPLSVNLIWCTITSFLR